MSQSKQQYPSPLKGKATFSPSKSPTENSGVFSSPQASPSMAVDAKITIKVLEKALREEVFSNTDDQEQDR